MDKSVLFELKKHEGSLISSIEFANDSISSFVQKNNEITIGTKSDVYVTLCDSYLNHIGYLFLSQPNGIFFETEFILIESLWDFVIRTDTPERLYKEVNNETSIFKIIPINKKILKVKYFVLVDIYLYSIMFLFDDGSCLVLEGRNDVDGVFIYYGSMTYTKTLLNYKNYNIKECNLSNL